MPYVNPSTFVAGNVLTAAQMNVLANNDRFFHGVPSVIVNRVVNQSIGTGVWTALQFDTEVADTDSIWSSTANNKLNVNTAGKYLIVGTGAFASSTGGTNRLMSISVNTTTPAADVDADGKDGGGHYHVHDMVAGTHFISHSAIVTLGTTDFAVVGVFQDSGGALNISNIQASIVWLSS